MKAKTLDFFKKNYITFFFSLIIALLAGIIVAEYQKYWQNIEKKADTIIMLESVQNYCSELNSVVINTNLDVTEASNIESNTRRVSHFYQLLHRIEYLYSSLLGNPSLLSSLSPQFRKHLSAFALNVKIYENKKYDVTELNSMYKDLEMLRKQEKCIELEIALLGGNTLSNDYKNRFYSILYPELEKDVFDNWK